MFYEKKNLVWWKNKPQRLILVCMGSVRFSEEFAHTHNFFIKKKQPKQSSVYTQIKKLRLLAGCEQVFYFFYMVTHFLCFATE